MQIAQHSLGFFMASYRLLVGSSRSSHVRYQRHTYLDLVAKKRKQLDGYVARTIDKGRLLLTVCSVHQQAYFHRRAFQELGR